MTTVHPAAAAKGIEVLASIPPLLPRILGDEGSSQSLLVTTTDASARIYTWEIVAVGE